MKEETKISVNLQLFRERIRKLRGEKSLLKASQDLGISRATLGYYESGDRKPDIEVLIKIANYYGVSSDYLLGLSKDYEFICEQFNAQMDKWIESRPKFMP